MTDPIRIPCAWSNDLSSAAITITPDLARQIVALACDANRWVMPTGPTDHSGGCDFKGFTAHGEDAKPQPVADDAADSADVLTMLAEMTLERDKALAERDTARARCAELEGLLRSLLLKLQDKCPMDVNERETAINRIKAALGKDGGK